MIKSSNFFQVFTICQLVLLQISGTLSLLGGQPEAVGNVPFVGQVYIDGEFACGCTVVSESFVVTAASCVVNLISSQLTIKTGASNLMDAGIISNVVNITVHPEFSVSTLDKDVAVLKLEAPIDSDLVKPIALCKRVSKGGEVAKLYGWGHTNATTNGLYSRQLHTVSMDLIGKRTCKGQYSFTMHVSHNMLCANGQGKSSCFGDIGDTVIINDEFCGIASGLVGCSHPNVPELFTNVFKVSKFITQTMEN